MKGSYQVGQFERNVKAVPRQWKNPRTLEGIDPETSPELPDM